MKKKNEMQFLIAQGAGASKKNWEHEIRDQHSQEQGSNTYK